jgi:protein-glutamine gamma-glutamyltransferase
MKLESLRVIKWYAATLGVAAGAVLYAYLGFGPVVPGVLIVAVASYLIVSAVYQTDEADSPYQKVSAGIAGLGMAAFLPLIFTTDFLIALVIFLGFAQLALTFQTHDYRRFYLGIFVSFVCICVGAAQARSGFYLVFFLAYTLCAGMAVGYAAMARRQPGQPLQWDWRERTRISLLMIVAAVSFYLILPRLPAGCWFAQPGSDHFYRDKTWEAEAKQNEGIHVRQCIKNLKKSQDDRQDDGTPDDRGGKTADSHTEGGDPHGRDAFHYDGFQKQFDINNPARRGQGLGNGIVARMRADHPQYLRARIFDLFDGLHWRSSSDQTVKLAVGFNGVDLITPDHYTSTLLQTYEVFIEQNLDDHIAAAAVPVRLQFPATAVGVDMFGQLRSPGPLKKGTAYAVTSQYHMRHSRLFAELDDQPLPSYTQLPDSLDPRIAALAGQITQGSPNQLGAAIALERHLRTGYQYNLDSALTSQGTTPIAKFLFETKNGHCEYFASALAVMLRTQDIPSRLVTGFSATNRNPLTGYYDIHALDAHAWVEALVDHEGWVVLEPTPYFDGPLPAESKLSAHQINDFVEHEMRRRKALGQNRPSLTAIINTIWHLLYVFVSASLGYIKLFILVCWPWMTACLAAAIGVWFTWRRYRHLWRVHRIQRRVAVYTGDDPRQAVTFYLTAIDDLLELAGFQTCPGDTIEHYLRRLEPIAGARSDPALAAAFNRIYYNHEAGDRQSAPLYKQLFQRLYEAVLHDRHSMGNRK